KELGGDLWEGKRTLMLLRLLEEAADDERARLVSVLAHDRRDRTAADVSWVRQRMDAYGCIDHARGVAHALAGAARHEAERLYAEQPDSRDRRFLPPLPGWGPGRR